MPELKVSADNTLVLTGVLTFYTIGPVCATIAEHCAVLDTIVVDLAGVGESDSASLVVLLSILRYASAHHKTVRFTNIPKKIITLIKLYDLQTIIKI
jgi:ABC-type transporter Mla MlaB component